MKDVVDGRRPKFWSIARFVFKLFSRSISYNDFDLERDFK